MNVWINCDFDQHVISELRETLFNTFGNLIAVDDWFGSLKVETEVPSVITQLQLQYGATAEHPHVKIRPLSAPIGRTHKLRIHYETPQCYLQLSKEN